MLRNGTMKVTNTNLQAYMSKRPLPGENVKKTTTKWKQFITKKFKKKSVRHKEQEIPYTEEELKVIKIETADIILIFLQVNLNKTPGPNGIG